MSISETNRAVAEAFSKHRFSDTYDHLAPEVTWTARGESLNVGKDAVIAACEASDRELAQMTTEFLTFRSVFQGDVVAVESVGRYQDPGGESSFVASVDLYDFVDGHLTRIVSYATEIEAPEAHEVSAGDESGR